MDINLISINGENIAEIISDEIEIVRVQDAIDIMANCLYHDARKIILSEKNIIPDFFRLSTGIAGDILQKFTNYNVLVAIVGDFSKYPGNSFKDFIYESNKTKRICFVDTIEKARELLS